MSEAAEDPIERALARQPGGEALRDRLNASVERLVGDWQRFFADAFVALAFNGISGDYAEFGSYGGTTLWLAHIEIEKALVPRHLWAFDSFEGLPSTDEARDEHPAWRSATLGMGVGRFRTVCDERDIPRSAYTTVEGFYDDTLPALGTDGAPTDIALAYVDSDMYSSAVSVLEFLEPRMKHGMIVAFDDYFCWSPNQLSGERAALHEFLAANPEWNFHRYRDIGWAGTSFVVERADLLRGS